MRFRVVGGPTDEAGATESRSAEAAWPLDWTSARHNAASTPAPFQALTRIPPSPLAHDLTDIAVAVYLADIAAQRGTREAWVREIAIDIPVRDPDFWDRGSDDLRHLLYVLTRDNFSFRFRQQASSPSADTVPGGEDGAPAGGAPGVDCVCLLSGGLDSFAGAAMLLHTGRRPLLVSHRSGNPTAEAAQRRVVAALERLAPGQSQWVGVRVAPAGNGARALPFPPPDRRESSRRARSFLFMALGAAAAQVTGVSEVYLCENGTLTAALPLTPARTGSLSTRSTHPLAVKQFTELAVRAGLGCVIVNPFVHQTKGEVVGEFLRPLVPPARILQSESCWAAGRQNRPCGGCIPCLLRRLALLAAGVGDEACMVDVLAAPERYRGSESYSNLVDLLTQAAAFLERSDVELVREYPQLLDLSAAGLEIGDTLRTLRRQAGEVQAVLEAHFPAAAALLETAVR